MDTKMLGFLGAPGVGKGTALEIVKQNTKEIAELLGKTDFSVYVARKFTSRPSRAGEVDKVGNVPMEEVQAMEGAYQLMGNHWYGYPKNELYAPVDLVILEPSIYQLATLKHSLPDALRVIGLIKSRELREKGLRDRVGKGDSTMDEVEIQKRLWEGDEQEAQIRRAFEFGHIDTIWEMDESMWSENPTKEGNFRDRILAYIENMFREN